MLPPIKYQEGRVNAANSIAIRNLQNAHCAEFHPDLPLLAVLSASTCIAVWETSFNRPHTTLWGDVLLTCMRTTTSTVLAGRVDGNVSGWSWSGAPLFSVSAHDDRILLMSYCFFSRDRHTCVFTLSDTTLSLFTVENKSVETVLLLNERSTCIHASQSTCVVGAGAVLYVVDSVADPRSVTLADAVLCCAVHPAEPGKWACGLRNGLLIISDGRSHMTSSAGHTAPLTVLVTSCTSVLLSCSSDATAVVWSWSGHSIAVIRKHNAPILAAQFNPVYAAFSTGSVDNTTKVWRVDGSLITSFRGHGSSVRCCAFHPAGHLLASVADDGVVRVSNMPRRLDVPVWAVDAAHSSPRSAAADSPRVTRRIINNTVVVDVASPSQQAQSSASQSPPRNLFGAASQQQQQQHLRQLVGTPQQQQLSSLHGSSPILLRDRSTVTTASRDAPRLSPSRPRTPSASVATSERREASLGGTMLRSVSPAAFFRNALQAPARASSSLLPTTPRSVSPTAAAQVSSHTAADRITRAFCLSAPHHHRASAGITAYITTSKTSLALKLRRVLVAEDPHHVERSFSAIDVVSQLLEPLQRPSMFDDANNCSAEWLQNITPAILVQFLHDNGRLNDALFLCSLASPLSLHIARCLRICALEPTSSLVAAHFYKVASMLLAVHDEVTLLPTFTGFAFRWCSSVVPPPSTGSEICFGAIPFCTTDSCVIKAHLTGQGELRGTIVVVECVRGAHVAGNRIFIGDETDIVFSPFVRFRVGENSLAVNVLQERLSWHTIHSMSQPVWMLHELVD